jgi:hypothetical protein
MGRAGTDGSRVVSGHNELNDEFLQVVEEHDSRDRANEIR